MRLFPLMLATILLTLGLAGCGQKGPLYLPQPDEAPQSATEPATAVEAPAKTEQPAE